jgi:hypothetical protein
MVPEQLQSWFNARWQPDMGAIDGKDLAFIAGLVARHRPARVVEIGVASGFSTACLATLVSGHAPGPARIDSFDLAERFYVDPRHPVGYLLAEALPHPGVTVNVHTGATCLDVAARLDGPIDLCFIDAAHRHPWPLIDTLGILPLMRPGGIVVHHDLKMYLDTNRDWWANGPKIVLDHVSPDLRLYPDAAAEAEAARRLRARSVDGNIFAFRVPEDRAALEWSLAQGFYLGWDPQWPILVSNPFADRFEGHLAATYGQWVGRAFAEGRRRYSRNGGDWLVPVQAAMARMRRPVSRALRRLGVVRG